ncbi:MAG: PAC2 family protein [Candidatus Micrarchaeota archaeon]|nr:PAC2 family protein [Candidatus Micrarchaeota archaeon]
MLDKTIIKMKKGIKPNRPVLVVGLPGIGNVGKLVAEHLRREFGAKKFATLYSPHFPHQVVMLKNGGIRLVNNRFYLIKAKKQSESDIVILTGDAQAVTPEGQYEVNSKIVEFFKERLGGRFIYTIGGYNIGSGMGINPRVFGNATDKKVIGQFKDTDVVFGKSKGMIWGSAGMIIAFAKMTKTDAICLMGETSLLNVDASAAKAVIIQLSKKLNLKVNTSELDKIIERTAKAITELEKQVGNVQQYPMERGSESEGRPSYIR